MEKTTKDRARCNSAESLDDATERRVLDQRSVSSEFVVIVSVLGQDPAQVRFAQDHDMIKAVSSDRADEPFDMSILPGRSRRRWSVADAHSSQTSHYGMAIGGVSVANEIARRLIPGKGFGDLLGDPLSCRIGGDVDPNQSASVVRYDHQAIEQPEADSRHDEHVDGSDVWGVIAQEGFPALRRRTASSDHVLGDSRLGDVKPELEQFTVNARRAPKWVCPAHLGDERAQLM